MRPKIISLIAFALTVILASACMADNKALNVYASTVQYPVPVYDSTVLLEIQFSLKRNEFDFFESEQNPGQWEARIYALAELFGTDGTIYDSASTYFAVSVDEKAKAEMADVRIFNKLQMQVKPGEYRANLTVVDVSSKRTGSFPFENFTVAPVEKEKLSIGGLTLAYNIRFVGEDKGRNYRMVKNGYLVYPSPIGIFSTTDSVMMLYAEAYNLDYLTENPGKYSAIYNVLEKDSSFFIHLGSREKAMGGKTAVLAESFDIKGWPKGYYNLQLIVTDGVSGNIDTALTPFVIMQPISDDQVELIRARLIDPYDELTLEEKIHLVEYLLEPHQKQTLANLTPKGKENYLIQYWKESDTDQSTEQIENRIEMIERFRYANENFSTNAAKDDGWLTSRGRIYVIYGEPAEIDDVQAPRIGNPYQVWYYRYLREGKLFVFEDWSGGSDYRMVHSNVDGEMFDQEWDDYLTKGIQFNNE
ncbi:MAG: GWxTD domain-containing protein [bacterium]|nr:GWxTD domain-containing protein [bacterium]